MAFYLNRAQVIGNLTRDPELRQTTSGQSVASLGVATNFSWTDSSGQRQEKAEFHNVVVWRKLAELCGQFLKKGSKIYVEGRLQTRDWQGEDGVRRYRTEIVADSIIFLDRKGAGVEAGVTPIPNEALERKTSGIKESDGDTEKNPPVVVEEEVSIDDLPF